MPADAAFAYVAPLLGALGLTIAWIVIVLNVSVLSGQEGMASLWMILPGPVLFALGLVWTVAVDAPHDDLAPTARLDR